MYLVTLSILLVMIIWAVYNWYQEWRYIRLVYTSRPGTFPLFAYPFSLFCLAGDIVITSFATGILGLGGLYGACAALFMSNLLSVVFFVPKCTAPA